MRFFPVAGSIICISMLAAPGCAMAQSGDQSPAAQAIGGNSAPGGVGAPGGSSGFGHHGGRGRQGETSDVPGEMPALKPIVEPRQRLDVGALLCQTEAQLTQHQMAIMARRAGKTAPEPAGCHIVGTTVAVAVLQRDGQARTEIQSAGDNPRIGWTDAVVQDASPFGNPLH